MAKEGRVSGREGTRGPLVSPVHWPCPLAFQGTGINSHLELRLQRSGCWKFLLEGVQCRGYLAGMGGFSSLVPSAEASLFCHRGRAHHRSRYISQPGQHLHIQGLQLLFHCLVARFGCGRSLWVVKGGFALSDPFSYGSALAGY